MRRFVSLLLLAAAVAAAAPSTPERVLAVEFPYYLYPRTLWERELVWLKSIGVGAVEFSIPWNWHQTQPGQYDLTGATAPRRDLAGLVRILRKLELRTWIRPLPPVRDWRSPALEPEAQRVWLKQLEQLLATQTVSHGGPIAWVEGAIPGVDAAEAPHSPAEISAVYSDALGASRQALASGRNILWRNVEDAVYPAGWAPEGMPIFRKGAVGLNGEERAATASLRREGALFRGWAPLLADLRPVAMPRPAAGKFPDSFSASEVVSGVASAVSLTNRGAEAFHDDLRVYEPASKRTLIIPNVVVPAGESLWLPLTVTIGPGGLCRECSHFAPSEHIVYATAELLAIEYENGILAMEFAAPQAGEAILQLARQPVGPFLAAGKPATFDWDDKALRARLPIPAGGGPSHRVRIGIAIEEPETSGFFNEARRLVIGQKNTVSTVYSAKEVASRSRLRLPEGFTATARVKSPNEIDYDVAVPADAIHGDWANLAIEADGMLLGRARLQLFRPVSIHLPDAIVLDLGAGAELTANPPIAPIEPKAGTNLEIAVRNNSPGIQTFRLEASGEGLDFFPPKMEISIGATDERRVTLRVFAKEGVTGLRDWKLRVGGGATVELPMRVLLLPARRTVAWSADLDGDGSPEWVLESAKARAVFSSQDGGRWMEFTAKDGGMNFLPEQGALAGAGAVEVGANGDVLEFTGNGWKRTARLVEGTLTIEQSSALPPDRLMPGKRGNVSLTIERPSTGTAVYRLN